MNFCGSYKLTCQLFTSCKWDMLILSGAKNASKIKNKVTLKFSKFFLKVKTH